MDTINNSELALIVLLLSGATALVIAAFSQGILFIILSLVAGWGIGVSVGLYVFMEFTPTAEGAALGLWEQNRLGSIFWLPILGSVVGTWMGHGFRIDIEPSEGKDIQGGEAEHGPPDGLPPSDVEVLLRQIKSLLDQGLIDQEDYDRKKRDILDDM